MKKTITICDKCGKEEPCYGLVVRTGDRYNGVETEQCTEHADLCLHCTGAQLQFFMDALSLEEGSTWYERLAGFKLLTKIPIEKHSSTEYGKRETQESRGFYNG